jgi:hypothetical protein
MNLFSAIAQHDVRKPTGCGPRARDEHGYCD